MAERPVAQPPAAGPATGGVRRWWRAVALTLTWYQEVLGGASAAELVDHQLRDYTTAVQESA